MPIVVRLTLMVLCLVVIALSSFNLAGVHPLRAVGLMGPDLRPIKLTAIQPTSSLSPARVSETTRGDLSARTVDAGYRPDPTQGTRHVTDSGVVWWGTGPASGSPRPVVILLHGAGRDGHSMVDMWYEVAKAENLILIAPNYGRIPDSPTALYDPRAALAALDQAETLYRVDRTRIVVFGHSRGGIAAQLWANRVEGPWKAVSLHAGTMSANLVRPIGTGIPIRHYLGSLDQTFPFPPAQESAQAMAKAGHPFELIRLSSHNHWFYDTGELIAADAWGWLKGHLGDS